MLRLHPSIFAGRRASAIRCLVVAVVSASALLLMPHGAAAQLTTDSLIGDSVSDVGGSKYADIDEAVKRFNNRDVLGARQFLEAAVRKSNSLPPVDMMLARMYFLSGNPTAGIVSLEKTAMDFPKDPEPYLILADQAIGQGQTIQAEALYDKAFPLVDSYDGNAKRKRNFVIRARTGRSAVAERRKNWALAVDDLNALIKVDPDNAGAHFRLGRALFMQNKTKEGMAEFTKAKELDKELPNPNVSAALMYQQLGNSAEAKTAFEAAVRADKADVKTLTAYAQWLLQTGDVAQAKKALTAARAIDAENLDILVLSGVAARMGKEAKPAEDYFVSALRLAPSNGAVTNQLALLLIEQPDKTKQQRALEFARINATMQPNSADANITLSWVLYQLGNSRDASAALRQGLQSGTLSPDSSYLVAKMLADQGQEDAAKQFLASALENTSNSLFVLKDDAQAMKSKLGKD